MAERSPNKQNLSGHLERKVSHDVKLSKALSYILRHGASKEGLHLTEGFIFVDDLLRLKQFHRYSEKNIKSVVASNDKQRFALRDDPETGRLQIRANQGHTIEVGDSHLEPITDHTQAPTVVHGTYHKCWELIKIQGLSRMKRNHIHFAPGEPGDREVISGMRGSCEILIFIDIKKALKGNEQGYLLPCYFDRVVQVRPRLEVLSSAK